MRRIQRRTAITIFISFFFFVAFILFTHVVRRDVLNQFDFDTTVRIQNHVPHRVDTFFSFLSLAGSFESLGLVLLVFLILRKKIWGIMTIVLFGVGHLIEIFGKSYMRHSGPPYMFFRYDLGFWFPSAYVQPGSSYPSGHSYRSIFVSILLIYAIIQTKRLKPIFKILLTGAIVAFTVLVLFSRVSLGEHWSTDVVGGTLLGLSFGVLATLFL